MNNLFNIAIFFPFEWKDALDILLVSILLYQIYKIIKGTVAVNIFIGVISIYLLGLIVGSLEMKLLSSIMRQVIKVGGIALIVLFQQEIRKFLILIGIKSYNNPQIQFLKRYLPFLNRKKGINVKYKPVVQAVYNLAKTKTGAIIILSNDSDLSFYINTGDLLDANVNSRLIENIFFKNSPLHDGAVIIDKDKIVAAICVLPVTEDESFPPQLGMRHRAAVGITEISDSVAIIVSEETGKVSYSYNKKLFLDVTREDMIKFLNKNQRH